MNRIEVIKKHLNSATKELDKIKVTNQEGESRFLGDIIKSARIKKNLSQTELADIIGTSTPQISHYENGKQTPTFTRLVLINKVLELNLSINDIKI